MKAQSTLMVDPRWVDQWAYKPLSSEAVVAPTLPPVLPEQAASHMPVWLFVSSQGARVLSVLPVDVEVSREGGNEESPERTYVFSCNKLHVFSSAVSYREAENQFHDQVVHFFQSYRDANPADLAEDAAEIRRLYVDYFRESEHG